MNWETKMSKIIEGALNFYTSTSQHEYEVRVLGEHHVEILHPQEPIFRHWNQRELSSCWREVSRSLISKILERRISNLEKEI